MKNCFEFSAAEKQDYCSRLTGVLVELRRRLGQTQEEMESVSGISRVTLSQIESGRSRMSWLHFSALMLLFCQNRETKELLYLRGVLDEDLLRVYQRLKPEEKPEFNPEAPMEPPVRRES